MEKLTFIVIGYKTDDRNLDFTGDDNLFINDKETIEDRINNLLDYANKNDYSIEDYEKELESLEKVLSFLQK